MGRAGAPRTDGRARMISVGAVEPGAGIGTVLHAMTLLRGEHPDLEYLVVGTASHQHDGGRYRQCIEALADDLGLVERIRFLERLPDARELLANVTESQLLAVPSPRRVDREQYDAIGMALSCGRPMVAVRTPVTAWRLRDGGVLVEPDDDEAFADAVHVLLDPLARPSVRLRARGGSTVAPAGTPRA
jgi:glycosyltransferase involved in cell wall biosynthesis